MSSWKNSLACVDDKIYAMTPPEAFNSWPPYTDSRTDRSQAVLLGRQQLFTQYRPGRQQK